MVTSGYTSDVVYPSAFGVFQAPVHLAWTAALARRAAPPVDGRPFRYCDLGTGAGLTLCVLADCYSEAEFHGVDLNPEHVRRGRALAAKAGLDNVVFHEARFEDLHALALPDFDFIALAGVYSWIPPELRAACLAFANARLTESGLVFVHYGALPGNAQIDPLYALLREMAADVEGDSLARFSEGARRVAALVAAKARFFQFNPFAAAWMEQIGRQDARSMAHEVLNAQRASLWASEVAAEAKAAGLEFVANAQLELNDLELCAPPALRAELAALPRSAREMALDTLRNTNSRMDVLMRRGAPAEAQTPGLWLDRLTTGPLTAERKALGERAQFDLAAPVFGELLAAVDGEARSLSDLIAPAGADARTGVERLVALKLLHVLRRPYVRRPGAPEWRMPSRLNRLVLEDEVEGAGALPFASPVAGTQVLLPLEDRLALRAAMGGDLDRAWARLSAEGRVLKHQGRPVTSAPALKAAALARAEQLGEAMPARLRGLGILS